MARILLVDDEVNILTVMSMLFTCRGDEVVTAHGGERAQRLLEAEAFDLMICDIRMKPVNGMEVLAFAREHSPRTAAIMVTAYDAVDAATRALELGAHAYLKKPFENDELLRLADEAMARRAEDAPHDAEERS